MEGGCWKEKVARVLQIRMESLSEASGHEACRSSASRAYLPSSWAVIGRYGLASLPWTALDDAKRSL